VTRVSKHLAYLDKLGVIQRIKTGRESIFVLGEWFRPPGWQVSKEFYYLENCFGIDQPAFPHDPNSDLAQKANSELQAAPTPTWPEKPNSNREANREVNTVSNGVQKLPDLGLSTGERESIAGDILAQLGDAHSRRFYQLVAAKVPEQVIRQALAEIKVDGARDPARVFTFRMNRHALVRLKQRPAGQASTGARATKYET